MTARHREGGAVRHAWLAGREPAALATLIGVSIKLAAAFLLQLTPDQQGLLNAATAALVGLIIAWATHDGAIAALLGLAQAAISLALGLGLKLNPDQQAVLMATLATLVTMYTRTQVTAPVPPKPLT